MKHSTPPQLMPTTLAPPPADIQRQQEPLTAALPQRRHPLPFDAQLQGCGLALTSPKGEAC